MVKCLLVLFLQFSGFRSVTVFIIITVYYCKSVREKLNEKKSNHGPVKQGL